MEEGGSADRNRSLSLMPRNGLMEDGRYSPRSGSSTYVAMYNYVCLTGVFDLVGHFVLATLGLLARSLNICNGNSVLAK